MTTALRAPFPWFGGKSRVARQVWERFGDVPNYVEPFAGSLAVLLGRPTAPRVETVNDVDCYLSNFWRALAAAPDEVARFADWPVNEADLHARHLWLVNQAYFRERMKTEPEFYDARVAGWWVWGVSQWIGSGWCSRPEWMGRAGGFGAGKGIHSQSKDRADGTPRRGRPCLAEGQGVHRKRPNLGGHNDKGVHRKRPALACTTNRGVFRESVPWQQKPDISGSRGAVGRGVHGLASVQQKLPKMDRGTESRLVAPSDVLQEWFAELALRLRRVRVCCGDWRRILGPSPTVHVGVTGVLLDPPYAPASISEGAGRDGFSTTDSLYAEHASEVSAEVRAWALEHGDDPRLRIALCGYEGEHDMPRSWEAVAWSAGCGYSNRGSGAGRNRHRERIWFSPHCLSGTQRSLFAREA